jgi:hypothetical protein
MRTGHTAVLAYATCDRTTWGGLTNWLGDDPAVQEACFDGWRIIGTQIWPSRGCGLPAASLQPACSQPAAAAAAIPLQPARFRRARARAAVACLETSQLG